MKNLNDLENDIFILKVSLSMCMCIENEGILKVEMVRKIVSEYL